MTVMTSCEFEDNIAKAQKATEMGPVFVTDHGQTTHVLMTLAQFEKIASVAEGDFGEAPPDTTHVEKPRMLADVFATEDPIVADFEFQQYRSDMPRFPDLS